MRIKADINSNAAFIRSHSADDAKRKSVPPALWLRLTLCLVTMALSGVLLYFVGNRLVSQIYYTKAKSSLKGNHHWIAVRHLKTAIHYQPDDFMFWRKLAEVYNTVGEHEGSIQRAFMYADRARKAYLESNRLNPLEASTVIGLAISEARLQQLYPYLYPDNANNPYNPLPYFKDAIHLRPNCIQYTLTLARYCHQTGHSQELLQVVQSLARISPGDVSGLEKEPFWSSEVQAAVKKGLQDAVEEKIVAKEAHRSLSQMLAAEQNWSEAILHFNKALALQKEISAGDYIQLGRLYLYSDRPEESIVNFINALTISPDKENSFAAITRIFDSRSHQHEFSLFYSDIESHFLLSPEMQIIAAKKFIDLKQLDKARRVLTAVNDYRPNGDAYYWLARIAEIEKDWDAMEINIQKATVLEPANEHYRNVFLQLRKRLGKDKGSAKKTS
jgi:tetratricopeptide (TPR) repeat protein